MDDDVTVKELIQKVSEELLDSEHERRSDGRRAVFEVAELTIELSFVVSRSRQGKAGVDLHVVSLGGEAAREDARTQRMTLRLVAASRHDGNDSEEFGSLDFDDALPVRPRPRSRDES